MTEISREYAEALFMLAESQATRERFSKELSDIRKQLEEYPEYMGILSSPAIPLSERLSLIDGAFGKNCHEHIISFMKLLCENKRIDLLYDIIDDFFELMRIAENRTKATVFYAEELSNEQKSALLRKLEAVSGKSVNAVYIADGSLIGGVKIEMDGRVIDGSISGRLNKIKGVIGK